MSPRETLHVGLTHTSPGASPGAIDSQVELFHSRMREVLGVAKWETWIKPLVLCSLCLFLCFFVVVGGGGGAGGGGIGWDGMGRYGMI